MSLDATAQIREEEAQRQFCYDLAMTAGSFLVPSLFPIITLAQSGYRIANNEESFYTELPHIAFGVLGIFPSFCAASFFTPLLSSAVAMKLKSERLKNFANNRFWNSCNDLIETTAFRSARNLFFDPLLVAPLVLGSLFASSNQIYDGAQETAGGETTVATMGYTIASNLLLLGITLLFSTRPTVPKKNLINSGAKIELTIQDAREVPYTGSLGDKLTGVWDIAVHAGPDTLWAANPSRRAFQRFNNGFAAFDERALRLGGVQKVVVIGKQNVLNACHLQKTGGAMEIEACHLTTLDIPHTDLAARLVGVDHGFFMKGDLRALPSARRLQDPRYGCHVIEANRNFEESAARMQAAFTADYPGRSGCLLTEFSPWSRTLKDDMASVRGSLYQRTRGERSVGYTDGAYGPDNPGRLWRQHWEPYARAIQHELKFRGNLHVVPSATRLSHFEEGGYRTYTKEYFAPRAVSPYANLVQDRGWNLERAAKRFRDDQQDWTMDHLLGDGHFTSFADTYYRFHRGGSPMGAKA